ncbi:MAG: recombinase family protein, partial [Actinomycetota bacterium]
MAGFLRRLGIRLLIDPTTPVARCDSAARVGPENCPDGSWRCAVTNGAQSTGHTSLTCTLRRTVTTAVYCRISSDKRGEGLGVERQRQACVKLAKAKGWSVGEVFTDNDISAYSGKRRPEYERMLEAFRSGRFDALIAWHPDRLHRNPREHEDFLDVVDETGIEIATVSAWTIDLATAAGRAVARTIGA